MEYKTLRQDLYTYMKEKYSCSPEFLWRSYPDYAVFRHQDNQKWFGIVMNVTRERLGLEQPGAVDIIDVKVDDIFLRDSLLQKYGFLPAWHMNKGKWITILLDGTAPLEEICEWIDYSYQLTLSKAEKEKNRPPKDWLIPSNPKYYDIVHAFDHTDVIEWKQGRGIRVGDTVYMYVAAPISAILYECQVLETDIPYDYQDRDLTVTAMMKIRLTQRYEKDRFTLDVLKEDFGITTVRGPRSVPKSLSTVLKA